MRERGSESPTLRNSMGKSPGFEGSKICGHSHVEACLSYPP